ncbi:MAG: adenylate kinase [Deltaproteobacteria bacterium]|nr:adenylate kinase [Deltaproteobacteria bacterium]MCL5792025.1 adenylate kinase [Deltaproteobacteria bacterium]
MVSKIRLLFVGPPGSGKGTQASILGKNYNIPQIATGDMLREEVNKGTELGSQAKGYMDRGELVPDQIVINMLENRLKQQDTKEGFILDGFPRTVGQAKSLSDKFEALGIDKFSVIEFKVDEENLVKRLSSRRVCSNCGAIYNLLAKPPVQPGICDKCGGKLYQRNDDKESTIRERFKVYNEKTAPLIDYYKNRGILSSIKAEGKIDTITSDINMHINKVFNG